MRFLAGTMHTIEQEFEDCVLSIRNQKDCELEHFVLNNMPHKEAHAELYSTFMNNAERFDFFIKVDADMVIKQSTFFKKLGDCFDTTPSIDEYIVLVHDFFPDCPVEGLHCWRNTVRWPEISDAVFVDKDPVVANRVIRAYGDLGTCVLHCPNPSLFQSFHYGMIRAVKALSAHRNGWFFGPASYLDMTWKHFLRTGDRRLLMASVGAELTFCGQLGDTHLDYACPITRNKVDYFASLSMQDLQSYTQRLRLRNRLHRPVLFLLKEATVGNWIRRRL